MKKIALLLLFLSTGSLALGEASEGKKTSMIQQTEIKGENGTWGSLEICAKGSYARGFIFRVQPPQGDADDTAGNAICLNCGNEHICSKQGKLGQWSEHLVCPEDSYLSGWRQNVQSYQGDGDDTALNNVEYRCRDIQSWESKKDLKAEAKELGEWSNWVECEKGEFICGIRTRVQDSCKGSNTASKNEGDKAGSKGEGDKAELKGKGDKSESKGEGDKAGLKGEGDKSGSNGKDDRAESKGEGDKAGLKGEGDKAILKDKGDKAGSKGKGDQAESKGDGTNTALKGEASNSSKQDEFDDTALNDIEHQCCKLIC